MTDSFWILTPSVLIEKHNIWPTPSMTFDEKLNALTRLIIIISVACFVFAKSYKILVSLFATMGIIIFIYYTNKVNAASIIEGFSQENQYNKLRQDFTEPSPSNPLMNVNHTEIVDNPNRKEAAPAFLSMVETEINESTKKFINSNLGSVGNQLFKSVEDEMAFEHSMRHWYTTANTTIPNDQKSFQEFCYGNMASCRDNTDKLACSANLLSRWTN